MGVYLFRCVRGDLHFVCAMFTSLESVYVKLFPWTELQLVDWEGRREDSETSGRMRLRERELNEAKRGTARWRLVGWLYLNREGGSGRGGSISL